MELQSKDRAICTATHTTTQRASRFPGQPATVGFTVSMVHCHAPRRGGVRSPMSSIYMSLQCRPDTMSLPPKSSAWHLYSFGSSVSVWQHRLSGGTPVWRQSCGFAHTRDMPATGILSQRALPPVSHSFCSQDQQGRQSLLDVICIC